VFIRSSDIRAISDDSPSAAADTAWSTVLIRDARDARAVDLPRLVDLRLVAVLHRLDAVARVRELASTEVVSTDEAFSEVMCFESRLLRSRFIFSSSPSSAPVGWSESRCSR
jgi:hypothetical protein